jgi:hypothetical protein
MYVNFNQVTGSFEEKTKGIGSSDAWIFKAKKDQNNETKQLLKKLDNIVGKMPDSESAKLKTRFTEIIPDNALKYIREFDDQFLEVLVEVLGWGWLKERYPRYTPQFTTTPDLLMKDKADQIIAAMECKKIRTSNEDRYYYENRQGTIKQVNDDLTCFLKKLRDTLCRAEKQVNKSNARQKFIFLDLSFDTEVWATDEQKGIVVCLIQKLAAELCQRGVALVSFEQFRVDKLITGEGVP